MKQSHMMSFIESIINIVVGFGISVAAQAIFLPMLGVPIPWTANFIFGGIMTVISIVRSYGLRRVFEALHIRRPLSPFMQAVIAERYRQIEAEGWSLDHDNAHEQGELALAGSAYAFNVGMAAMEADDLKYRWGRARDGLPLWWPWERDWWKPAGFRRDLVKGCALIVAEGERFDRMRKEKRKGSLMTDDKIHERSSIVTPIEFAHGKNPREQGGASA